MLKTINIRSSVAVYVQIENEVQFAIASGRLKGGDRLPSIQSLATQLGVNPNTIAKAYRDLEVMGLTYARRGEGVFVAKGIESKCRQECRKRTMDRLREVTGEAKAAGMSLKEVKDVVAASIASGSAPYAEVPSSILSLAKTKKG